MRIKNLTLNSDDQVITKITGEVLRAFHIEVSDVDVDVDFDEFKIFNEVVGDKILTRLIVKNSSGEQIFKSTDIINPDERRGAEIHRLIKKNLYKILTGDLKLRGVPYGIMHGVRPTKIFHRWLRSGYGVTSHGVIDRDRISRRLRADYLTNYEKSLLLTEVALRQIPILSSSDEKTIGVYVGIPFCVTRCLYCSFPSNILPSDEKVAEFMEILTRDIDAAASEIKRYGFKVQSIYVGGGTPTSLPQKFFNELLAKITAAFYNDSVEEFTVECGRADTIDDEKITTMKNYHVTRVCVNPQTMQDKTLERIGREHTAAQVVAAFEKLRTASDWRINMDLILGLPGESFDDVIDSLNKVVALEPDDVTLHALALKRGSQLQVQLADEISTLEDFELPSDEEVRRMADAAEKILRGKHYQPYYLYRQGYISGGIENIGYCKCGAECIYNVQIMDERQTILGVGTAASTKVPDNVAMRLQTSFNAKDLTTYLRDIDKYIDNRSKVLAEVYTPVEVPVVEEIVVHEEEKEKVMAYVSKEDLAEVFQDTKAWYESDEKLKNSVQASIDGTKFYDAGSYPTLPEKKFGKTLVTVTKGRTFGTAVKLRGENPTARIAVHNFASATNPGGGVVKGSRAQEEALCRCSTLYPVLDTKENWKRYYKFHRDRQDTIYTDACIFTPNIIVCKSDIDLPQRLPQSDWVTVDVMTIAAPNLRHMTLSDAELLKAHEQRARHMFTVLANHGVEIFVTGAFGCGAFRNNPYVVAQAYKNILAEFDGYFKEIIFAVYCTPRETQNFDAFNKILN